MAAGCYIMHLKVLSQSMGWPRKPQLFVWLLAAIYLCPTSAAAAWVAKCLVSHARPMHVIATGRTLPAVLQTKSPS